MDMPNGESNPVAGVLNGFGGNNANRGATNTVSEELLNSTLAGFPGGAEAFWENMQGTGIGRDEFLQMLAGEMYPSLSVKVHVLILGINQVQFHKHQVHRSNLLSFLNPLNLQHNHPLSNKLLDFPQICNLNSLLLRLVSPVEDLAVQDGNTCHSTMF